MKISNKVNAVEVATLVFLLMYVIGGLGFLGVIVWVAWHFISKYW